MQVEGQCHCGAIAFAAEVQPGTMTICHCIDCQTHSGSAFRANIPASAHGFRLLKGSPRTYVKTAASGAKRVLAFCDHCGSPLYACAVENPQTYSLRTGVLKQRDELGTPKREIWAQRRRAWVGFAVGFESFDGEP